MGLEGEIQEIDETEEEVESIYLKVVDADEIQSIVEEDECLPSCASTGSIAGTVC